MGLRGGGRGCGSMATLADLDVAELSDGRILEILNGDSDSPSSQLRSMLKGRVAWTDRAAEVKAPRLRASAGLRRRGWVAGDLHELRDRADVLPLDATPSPGRHRHDGS